MTAHTSAPARGATRNGPSHARAQAAYLIAEALSSAHGLVHAVVRAIAREAAARRAAEELEALDDRLLEDIGLPRHRIRAAVHVRRDRPRGLAHTIRPF